MKRRIRKKKHLAEFAEFGRVYQLDLQDGADIDLLIDWIIEVIELQQCQYGGWIGAPFIIQLGSSYDDRDARHLHILEQLQNNAAITSTRFSEEFDLTYDATPSMD